MTTPSTRPGTPPDTLDEQSLKQYVADELERSRDRSIGLTTAVLDEGELLAQHSRLMSPLVWDLAHVGNYEELWLLREAAGIEAMRPELDDIYDAFEHPRATRPTLPLLKPAEAGDYIGLVRRKVLDALDAMRLDPSRELLDSGFVFGMVLQHEHQHDETMLATHQLRRGDPVLPGHRRAAGAVGADHLRRGARPGRPLHDGHVDRPLGAGQRAARARGARARRTPSTPSRSPTPPTARSSRPAATTTSGCGRRPAGGGAASPASAPPRSGSARAAPGCGAGSPASSRCPTTSRCSTSAGSRPTPTPAGPAAGCPPRPSGRRPPPGTPPTRTKSPVPLGRRGADADERANLGQTRYHPARGRLVPRRRLALRRAADDRRRVGVDLLGVHRLPGLPVVPLQGVLRGVLRRRLQGAARWLLGHRPAGLPHHVPQLGPPDPAADLRRLPHGAGRLAPSTPRHGGRCPDVPSPGLPR